MPHKPILILAVIDLFEEGAITDNKIYPSPQIVESFLRYWHLVSLEKPHIFLQEKGIYLPKEKLFCPSLTMIRRHCENSFIF